MQVNQKDRVVTARIVYYGPAGGGKTTNLKVIHRFTDPERRSTLSSLKTEGDQTLFLDLLPFELGSIMSVRFGFKIYTVPGLANKSATREKVLGGADGVVFVADSQQSRAEDNRRSFAELRTNLKANRINPDTVPLVLQYNKQDLSDLMTDNELDADLNTRQVPTFNSVALRGKGVLETLAAIIKETIQVAIGANGNDFQRLKDQDLNLTLEKIFAPFFVRTEQHPGDVRIASSRFKEVRLCSKGIDGSTGSDEDASQFVQTEQRIGKMHKDLATLAELTTKASTESDFDQVLTKTLDLAMENTGVDSGSLLLVTGKSKTLGEKILRGLDHDPLNATEMKGVGSMAYLLTWRKEATITNNVADYPHDSNSSTELQRFHGIASYPLVAQDIPLGLINLYTTQPSKRFCKEEEDFLTILSTNLGLYLLSSFYALKYKTHAHTK